MRILFLHQNFPAQWSHLARHYAQSPAHEVVAITDKANPHPDIVRTLRYEVRQFRLGHVPETLVRFGKSVARGYAAAPMMLALRQEGFFPDVIAGHPGWGETLVAKEVWPDAKLLIYGEWFYQSKGTDVNFDPEFTKPRLLGGIDVPSNNATMAIAAAFCDAILTPTMWQRDSFPKKFRPEISVIHDGIDTQVIRPNPKASVSLGRDKITVTAEDEILTFACRNLEPYRGYHIFMRALPRIMAERPNARVIIVGGDRTSYGGAAPPGKTWKSVFLEEVAAKLDTQRLHFVGWVPHKILWDVFAVSTCHVYLTYPFVLSWSLLEAMAMECLVVGSATAPVREVIDPGRNGLLVDFFDVNALADAVIGALADRDHYAGLRRAARRTVVERYDLRTKSLPRLTRLIEGLVPATKLKPRTVKPPRNADRASRPARP